MPIRSLASLARKGIKPPSTNAAADCSPANPALINSQKGLEFRQTLKSVSKIDKIPCAPLPRPAIMLQKNPIINHIENCQQSL